MEAARRPSLDAPRSAAATSPDPDAGALCELLVLVRLQNFAFLRRLLGRARAHTLPAEVTRRLSGTLAFARIEAAARDLVEVSLACGSREQAQDVLDRVTACLAEPFLLDGESFGLQTLVGAALAERPPRDEVRIVEEAETALAEARAESPPVLRDVTARSTGLDALTLESDLTRAVEDGELFLQYQPKVHVRQHRVTGVEALVRWRHPRHGLVLPGDFIPLAEKTRAIAGMTLWTIRQAIADQRAMRARGHDLRVFVNIAGVLLGDRRFIRRACALVAENGASLGFEVTETSVIRDPEVAIAHLAAVSEAGITVAIDDYGAGLSSLAYLKRLPARELKIDKLFVTQLTSSNRDPLIVRSTIDLAHALEMDVVAEGVEAPAALALLTVMGCDMVQGYLISRPVGLDALLQFLDAEEHRRATETSRATFHKLAAGWKRG